MRKMLMVLGMVLGVVGAGFAAPETPKNPQSNTKKESAAPKKAGRAAEKGKPEAPALAPAETFSAATFSLSAPKSVEEGGMLLVHVQANPEANPVPEAISVRWRNKKHVVPLVQGQGLVLLPSPLDPETRGLNLDAANGKDRLTVPVRILPVNWAVQRITVDPKYVNPPKDVTERIAADRARTKAALATVRPERFWTPPFVRPVEGGVSSAYGGKRVFNDQPRSRHRGVDLRGAEGTPIVSAAAGRVLLAEDQYFSGNVVYVDHGQGLVTMYCHMSVMQVTPGQTVQAGEVLGLVGATGRVTGPHLHLSTLLHGESVNPMALFVYN